MRDMLVSALEVLCLNLLLVGTSSESLKFLTQNGGVLMNLLEYKTLLATGPKNAEFVEEEGEVLLYFKPGYIYFVWKENKQTSGWLPGTEYEPLYSGWFLLTQEGGEQHLLYRPEGNWLSRTLLFKTYEILEGDLYLLEYKKGVKRFYYLPNDWLSKEFKFKSYTELDEGWYLLEYEDGVKRFYHPESDKLGQVLKFKTYQECDRGVYLLKYEDGDTIFYHPGTDSCFNLFFG